MSEFPRAAVLSDDDIIDIAKKTASADPGRDGYILPTTFARAIIKADREARAVDAGSEPLTEAEIRKIIADRWPTHWMCDSEGVTAVVKMVRAALAARSAPAADAPEPIAWGAFHIGGNRNGKLYSQCDTEAQVDAYIQQVHQSNDSITLRKAPLYTAPAAAGAAPQAMPADCKHQRRCADPEHNWCPDCGTDLPHPMLAATQPAGETQAADVLREFDRKLAEVWGKEEHPHAAAYGWVRLAWEAALARPAAGAGEGLTEASRDVLAERARQINEEGWTPEHDDKHHTGSMALAAACYACNAATWAQRSVSIAAKDYAKFAEPGFRWPWAQKWWKPKSQRADLIRAGALILAEIERMDRAALSTRTAQGGQE